MVIQETELTSYHPFLEHTRAQCIFEYVYFARPDSKIFGTNQASQNRHIQKYLVRGAFSLVLLTDDHLIAARDPYGFRPLCLGKYKDSWVVASETCAFDLIDAKFVREVEPGEIVVIQGTELTSYHPFLERTRAQCIFEYVYFARPDSKIFGTNQASQNRHIQKIH